MTNDERILLAEFCELPECHLTRVNLVMYRVFDNHLVWKEFAPDTDANDCEALIRRLNEKNWEVHLRWWRPGSYDVWIFPREGGSGFATGGDDYKQGVCELAIPIARERKDG